MQFLIFSLLVLVLIVMGLFIWRLIVNKEETMVNREFTYLRWVIYVINLLIFALAFALVVGLVLGIFTWLGPAEWGHQFPAHLSLGFSIDSLASTPIGFLIEVVNTVATLGILICMRAFMKNIIAEDIFIPQNVGWARLSTVFLVLGSLIRQGNDTASIVIHSYYSNAGKDVSFEYGFFNMYYLLTAALVWTLSIILEKAIIIADENEFTI